jgi:predicted MFS family arabinose efflux permease
MSFCTEVPMTVRAARACTVTAEGEGNFSLGLQLLLGTACGLLIASVYYAQPLTGLIGADLGIPPESDGLLVTLPLVGYGVGLLMVVPLGDLFENRRLVLVLVGLEVLCLLAISMIAMPFAFLAAACLMGAAAAAVQILVPYATYLAPETQRGRAVGRVVSGVMLGIMLARPASSLATELWGWPAIFRISAGLMAVLFVALCLALPPRRPAPGLTYSALLGSMGRIFVSTEVLRRRAFYHGCMFGAFSVFWTAVPLWLSSTQFGLSQGGIAWVALAGVAGAVAPPIAGRVVDRGFSQTGTALAMLLASATFGLPELARPGSALALALVVAAAVLLDFSVSANLVFSQRAIFALNPEQRSRLNGLFMASFFAGGAIGSALGGWCYTAAGWTGVVLLGAALPILGLVYFATECFKSTWSISDKRK